MIICRFSLPLLALAACAEETYDPEPVVADDEFEVRVTTEGRSVSLDQAIRDFAANPNRFQLEYEGKVFDVRGDVARVPVFNEELNPVIGYHLPLKHGGPVSDTINQMAREESGRSFVRNVSVSISDFSIEQAAELEVGQTVNLQCTRIAVVSEDVVFRDCTIS